MAMLASSAIGAEEVHLFLDGTTLNADRVLVEGKDIEDDVILIVHGTLGHKDMEIIETLQTVLQESGHHSLAINLSLNINDRHGFYPCDNRHAHRSEDAFVELAAWAGWLRSQGASRIILLGHSRGANQATRYVLSSGTPISSLVLLAPPTTGNSLAGDELRTLTEMNPTEWLSDKKFLHCEKADVQVRSYLSYRGPDANNDTVALMQNLQIPTLVISGSEDAVVSELASRMPDVANKFVEHVEVDGAGHFFRDLYTYDVVDAIDAFLDKAAR